MTYPRDVHHERPQIHESNLCINAPKCKHDIQTHQRSVLREEDDNPDEYCKTKIKFWKITISRQGNKGHQLQYQKPHLREFGAKMKLTSSKSQNDNELDLSLELLRRQIMESCDKDRGGVIVAGSPQGPVVNPYTFFKQIYDANHPLSMLMI